MPVDDSFARMEVDRSAAMPPYSQLCSELRRRILDGRLKPGQQLPSVTEIARLARVSRATAMRATGELARHGLILQRWGSGNYVAEAPLPTTEVMVHAARPQAEHPLATFYGGLVEALREGFGDATRRISLSYVDGHVPTTKEVLDVTLARRADSLIVYRPHGDFARELRLAAEQIPTVALFYPIPGAQADVVSSDPAPALRSFLRQRIAARRPAFFLSGRADFMAFHPEDSPYTIIRRTFLETLREAGVDGQVCLWGEDYPTPGIQRELEERLRALPDGAVVVTHSATMPDLPQKRFDCIGYTEFRGTLDRFRDRMSMLYLDLHRVARAAVQLLLERKSGGPHLEPRTVRLVPEIVEASEGERR